MLQAIGSLEKRVCGIRVSHVMASDVIPVTCKTSCKYVYARHSRYGMLIKETACFSNNKNVLHEGISLRHSILNKEMLIDQLTATRDRICMFFK